jgi:hypothetical protein
MENVPETDILKFCNDKHTFCKNCFYDYLKSTNEDEDNDDYDDDDLNDIDLSALGF